MTDPTPVLVAHGALSRFCADCFEKLGLPPADAEWTASSVVWASLRGIESHGLNLMREYAERIRRGGIDPGSHYATVSESATTAIIEAAGGVGQVAGRRGMTLAVAKAAQAGVGIVGVRNSSHFGAAACYSVMAVEHNMIGLASTNAPPSMAPWGGKAPLLGTNPVSIAVPAGRNPPVVLDMATSASAWGKVFIAMRQGQKIPLNWALDRDGEPTDDPARAIDGGMIQPLGGYKGYGLSLIIDVLTGVLTGSSFANQIPAWDAKDQRQGCGHLLMAVRIDAFIPVDEFRSRMDQLISLIKNCPRASDSEPILLPGEIESGTEAERRAHGIPIHSTLQRELASLGQELKVAVPF